MRFLQKCGRSLPRFVSLAAGIFLAYILCLLLLAGQTSVNVFSSNALLGNELLFLMSLALLTALCALYLWRAGRAVPFRQKPRKVLLWIAAAHVLMLGVQLVLVRCLWVYPDWDMIACYETAEHLARGGQEILWNTYFANHPNNAPLTLLHTALMWIAVKLGWAVPYLMLPIGSAVFGNLASLFSCLTLYRLTGSKRATAFGGVLGALLFALSPFITLPYTDAFCILFPILAIYLYLCPIRTPLKWFLVTFVCGIGSLLKPTVLIVWFALLLLAAGQMLARLPWSRAFLKRALLVGLAVVAGILPSRVMGDAATFFLAGSLNPEAKYDIPYFLMMGLNQETYGSRAVEDADFAGSIPTLEERNQICLAIAKERFESMSPLKAVQFFSAKMYKTYNSGTFHWNGSYVARETPRRTDALSQFLRNVYHTESFSHGRYNRIYITVMQVIWLLALPLCILGLFFARKKHSIVAVLALSIIGINVYQMLFECSARYLFAFSPFYVLLATLGMQQLCLWLRRRFPGKAPLPNL